MWRYSTWWLQSNTLTLIGVFYSFFFQGPEGIWKFHTNEVDIFHYLHHGGRLVDCCSWSTATWGIYVVSSAEYGDSKNREGQK